MNKNILDLIDFEKVDILLEGFNKSTGFVTAILDLEGNILSKSGWRQICTEFHRAHPETMKKCTESDTVLAGQMAAGEKYHFYKCLNGLIDVAVPIIINDEHIANLFSGQFFFEKPDREFFKNQAIKHKFDSTEYLNALDRVPVVSKDKVKTTMDFLLNMTQLISEMTIQRLEQVELNKDLKQSKERWEYAIEGNGDGLWDWNPQTNEVFFSKKWKSMLGYDDHEIPNSFEEWDKRVHPDDKTEVYENIKKHIDGTTNVYTNEHRLLCKDGAYKWMISRGRIVSISDDKKPLRIIGTLADINKRKLIEAEIRKFKTFTEHALHGNAITNLEGTLVYINKAFAEIHGYEPDELIGKSLSLFHNKEQLTFVNKLNKELLENGNYNNQEVWHVHRNGTEFPMLMSSSVFKDDTGKPEFFVANAIDITKRKQAENLLLESEVKYRRVSDNSPAVLYQFMVSKDGDRSFPYISNRVEDIFGIPAEEVMKDPFKLFNMVIPDDWEEFQKSLDYSAEVLESFPITFRCKREGEIIWIEARGVPMKLNDGGIIWDGYLLDVTDRKKAEESLIVSEEKFRTLIDEIPAGVYLTDVDGKCNYVNPTWCKMGGLSLDEAKGDGWKIGIHPEDRNQVSLNWDKMIKSNGNWGFEYRQFDGVNSFWVDGRAKELKSDGELKGYLGINTDITERKNSENILIDNKNRLEVIFNNTKDYQLLVEPDKDNDFRIVAVNKSYVGKANQLGIDISEIDLIGKSFRETLIKVLFIDEETAKGILKNYVKVVQTKEQIEFKEDLKVNDIDYYAEISLTPVLDVQGDCKYILYNSHDISEKNNAEKELEKHRIHLEDLVKERTKELEVKNEELERINKLFIGRELRMVELKDEIKSLQDENI